MPSCILLLAKLAMTIDRSLQVNVNAAGIGSGHWALLFSLSSINSGLHNPFEFLFHMDKQASQLWDSNHKGQKSKWQAREIYFHHINRTHSTLSLCRPNHGSGVSVNQNERWILTSRIFRHRNFHLGLVCMLHGQRPIVLVPGFQTQKLFPVLFEQEKAKIQECMLTAFSLNQAPAVMHMNG